MCNPLIPSPIQSTTTQNPTNQRTKVVSTMDRIQIAISSIFCCKSAPSTTSTQHDSVPPAPLPRRNSSSNSIFTTTDSPPRSPENHAIRIQASQF